MEPISSPGDRLRASGTLDRRYIRAINDDLRALREVRRVRRATDALISEYRRIVLGGTGDNLTRVDLAALRRAAVALTTVLAAEWTVTVGFGALAGAAIDHATRRVKETTRGLPDREDRVELIDLWRDRQRRREIRRWTRENASLITTIPSRAFGPLARQVEEAARRGLTVDALQKVIRGRWRVANSRARLLARDQLGKLHGRIQQQSARAAGAERFMWLTVSDQRVRREHAAVHGRIFDYATGAPGTGTGGGPSLPGEAIQCRCIALPRW